MTQTPNDAEIQNVLSSIRRLINDSRPAAGEAPLVLAPSLRIDEPAAPEPEPLVLLSPVVPPAPVAPPAEPLALETPSSPSATREAPSAEPPSIPAPPPPPEPLLLRQAIRPAAPERPGTSSTADLVPPSEPAAPPPAADPAPGPAEATPEAALPFDERVLRLLIAEVVREELQGELGERMTRNLRKLVRREILQALAAARDEG